MIVNYAYIEEDVVLEYPLTEYEIRSRYPNILFPAVFSPPEGWIGVESVIPEYDPSTQTATELTPELIEGVWKQVWSITDKIFSETELNQMFSQEKELAFKRVNLGYSLAVGSVIASYPILERESWPSQVSEAKLVLANSTEATPWIDAAAISRGIDKTELANKIVAKDLAFRALSGNFSGIRQRLETQIEAIIEVSLENIQLLKTIVWVSE